MDKEKQHTREKETDNKGVQKTAARQTTQLIPDNIREKLGLVCLDDWQKKFLLTEGDKIMCGGRQASGKSTTCAEDAGNYLLFHEKVTVLMIAPLERQAYGLFSKTLNYLTAVAPKEIKKGKERPTLTRLSLKNGSTLWCLPVGTTGLGVRFMTIHRLYVDEASRIPEEVWSAVMPALLVTGGNCIYLSTPFGKRGEYWRCWSNENNAYTSFTRFSTNSEKVINERPFSWSWTPLQKERSLAQLAKMKARMSEREYAQEILGEFVDDLSQFFPDELIKKVCIIKREQRIDYKNKKYMGIDVGGLGGDLSTFEIIERVSKNEFRQRENITKQRKYTTETTAEAIRLHRVYKTKAIGVDDAGVGFGVFSELLKHPETKRVVKSLNNASRDLDKEGKKKKRLLKVDMYMNLLSLMQQDKIRLLDDEELIYSLQSMQSEFIVKPDKPTEVRISGSDSHIAEGLVRAAWLASEDKRLNIYCY